MIQDDLPTLFAYTRWADTRMLETIGSLDPERYTREPAPGWSSVRATLVHMASVVWAWSSQLDGTTIRAFPDEESHPAFEDAAKLLHEAYDTCDRLLAAATPEILASIWETHDPRGNPRRLPFWAVYRHLANHQTYHRGQLASKLKRLGVDAPFTDFVFYVLEQVPQPEGSPPAIPR
ncbi:DinB family protein [Tundrisphaera sp. TA3]|uniref:DinB family protein n=1 Tax=Tundrisphaera sp. TA3 TaxID=3435775 RepID=UPI003EB6C612